MGVNIESALTLDEVFVALLNPFSLHPLFLDILLFVEPTVSMFMPGTMLSVVPVFV